MLAYKENKLGLITVILYIKNSNDEGFIGFKAHAPDILCSCFDRLLGL